MAKACRILNAEEVTTYSIEEMIEQLEELSYSLCGNHNESALVMEAANRLRVLSAIDGLADAGSSLAR